MAIIMVYCHQCCYTTLTELLLSYTLTTHLCSNPSVTNTAMGSHRAAIFPAARVRHGIDFHPFGHMDIFYCFKLVK